MNYRAALACLVLALPVALQPGCQQAPSERVFTVRTLAITGETAKATVQGAARLLADGKITVAQFQQVAAIYDTRFQPAFALAVAAAHSDLSSVASPDLIALATQLADTVATFTRHP